MISHTLKVWPEYFQSYWDGTRTHSIRKFSDRVFVEGDEVRFVEYVPDGDRFTGRWVMATITHIDEGGRFGTNVDLPSSLVVFSFVVKARSDQKWQPRSLPTGHA